MKKALVAVALAIVFVLALAAPAFAQVTHTAAYELDGTIDFEKQAGHKCNTGAEIKQTIVGNGVMDKVQTVSMNTGKISMEDDNNWVAGATPLTVTTVWDLCAPAKQVYDGVAVPLEQLYRGPGDTGDGMRLVGVTRKNAGFFQNAEFEALTDQIWAVQVQADAGFSGNLYQDGVAAHGAFAEFANDLRNNAFNRSLDYDYDNWSEDGIANKWAWVDNSYGIPVPTVGPDFVGSYFDMEQHARTSMGTLRRYISISSPFNHSYLTEDMSIIGKSDVQETFSLQNLPAGADMPGLWWDLF